MKLFFRIFIILFIFLSCVSLALFIWYIQPTGIMNNSVDFEIKNGDTSYSVAQRLYLDGIIKSKLFFYAAVRLLRFDKRLKTGWVKISPGANMLQIIIDIYSGNFITVKFTIPEGTTFKQILSILEESEIVTEEEIFAFVNNPDYLSKIGLAGYKSPEGFLYPETYKFFKGVQISKVLSSMVELFYEKIEEIYPGYKTLSKDDLYDKIIMASIIEKEVKLKEEADIVSGVFYNRIKSGMRLQSCATVQYILGKPREQLLESDLMIMHPYNTYLNKGLPPGPICNPGYTALNAAFYPDHNNYLFFVVKDPEIGRHHFSSTYDDHLAAKQKYKELKGFY
ncbi:MAG: endolytic transglycosylase MltG [Spirochaetes bacterium]|nr:endolytic transglycosylase MltG [Spirochaetota bacterium]